MGRWRGERERVYGLRFGWRSGEGVEKSRVRMGGREVQDKERVMKGDDVNESEVWKQRFISILEHQTQYRGRGETKGERRRFGHSAIVVVLDMVMQRSSLFQYK